MTEKGPQKENSEKILTPEDTGSLEQKSIPELAQKEKGEVSSKATELQTNLPFHERQINTAGGNLDELQKRTAGVDSEITKTAREAEDKLNTWIKLNEPKFNENNFYRIVNENGYKDFLENKVVRSSPTGTESFLYKGIDLGHRPTSFPSFDKGTPDFSYLKDGVDNFIFESDTPMYRRGDINPATGSTVRGRHWAYRPIDEISGKVLKSMPSEMIKNIYKVDPDGNVYMRPSNSVEAQANSPENPSTCLFSRMRNTKIQEQVIGLLAQQEDYLSKKEDIEVAYDDNGDIIFENEKVKTKKVPSKHLARTPAELQETLDRRLVEVSADTPISYDNETPSGNAIPGTRENMPLYFEMNSGELPTTLQKSIIEAHEKGHVLRPYEGSFFANYFSAGFDASAIQYSTEEYEKDKKRLAADTETSFEEARRATVEYLSDGREIAERMSQLKNYFGMTGDEPFTKEHLDHARTNYIKDTGLDNHMGQFFQGITPEKEPGFLALINNSGI